MKRQKPSIIVKCGFHHCKFSKRTDILSCQCPQPFIRKSTGEVISVSNKMYGHLPERVFVPDNLWWGEEWVGFKQEKEVDGVQ